ncbi:hypothetical protein C3L33_11550, partial [Rhododendron williamsianum]
MEGEIKNLVEVLLSILSSLCFCYFVSSKIPKGKYRFLSLLPIFSLFTLLPLRFTYAFPTAVTAFFITWLANFKLLLFAFDLGPLSSNPPKSLPLFITLASLPIKITNPEKSQNYPPDRPSKLPTKLPLNLVAETVIFSLLIGALFDHRERIHPKIVLVLYCCMVFLMVDVLISIANMAARAAVGLELEPPSNEPYLATSLQDFWGRRWNLMVTNNLRHTVYNPVRSALEGVLGRETAQLPAVMATFIVSGLMHELLFYYVARVSPTWEMTGFFVLHGACVVAEHVVRRAAPGRRPLHRAVAGPLTVGFVVATSFWLFFPPTTKSGADVKVIQEFKWFLDFTKRNLVLICEKFIRNWHDIHAKGKMAVEACVTPKMMNDIDDDDDEVPLVFKRSNTASRQNLLNSATKKPSSQKHDGPSGKHVSEMRSPNGQNSISQKGKAVPSTKPSPVKSPSASPKASTTTAKASLIQMPVQNSKTSTSVADHSKRASQHNPTTSIKEEKPSKPCSDSEDSEDDKPLSFRLTTGLPKGNSNNADRKPNNSSVVSPSFQKVKHEDSDDEMPLSSRFLMKSVARPSTSKSSGYDDNKPMAPKIQQNGSTVKDNQLKKSSPALNKRPLGDIKSSSQSSIKRPKLSEGYSPNVSKNVSMKVESKADDEDDNIPISQRLKKPAASGNKSSSTKQKVSKVVSSSSFKKTSKKAKKGVKDSKYSKSSTVLPGSGEGQKWTTLIHNGVIFPPPYKPHGVATMYAVMLDTDYMTKDDFKKNFMNDWKKILGRNHVIQRLEDCDFTPIYEWHQKEKEKKKQMSTEEKKALKEEKLKLEEKYMWAVVDGVKEKVGNFRVEPPGLFRGRGDHPKMGKLKKRIRPRDITINIGKNVPIPECPIPGESWKEVRHDNTVTWLAYWHDPINPKEFKYVFLAPSSSLKGLSDKEKYEKARLLKDYIGGIRTAYKKDFTSKDITKRQIAVATYLIDKLALRAGNEKDDDEADTFDFLGKDSIRYQNLVLVETPVFKAIQQFRTGKDGTDDLFDKLDTSKLNAHLKELMPGLTAKVFRTYNASITLDEQLSKQTRGGDVTEKVVVYQHANKEVAIICNHQRTVSKSHSAQMTKLNEKIEELKGLLDGLEKDLALAKKGKPPLKGADGKPKKNLNPEAWERKIAQTTARIEKMERDKETKEDLKTVALGTSKINYLDPRISVAWCKRHEVPIEKIFNKSLLAKFAWAMDVDPSFRF